MTLCIRCCLQILSPVHVGCDEVYEPMTFFLDEASSTLCQFDPLHFIGALSEADQREFSTICQKGTIPSILELYKFVRSRGKPDLALHKVQVCSGLLENFRKSLSLPAGNVRAIQQELNNFVIQRTAFLPASTRPYIPGSAIKGALRTAHLNGRAKARGTIEVFQGRNAARDLEKTLLGGGSFHTDPFRLVKVSDFHPVGEVRTRVVYAVNRKKQHSKLKGFEGQGPFQIMEVIQPGSVFEGWITVSAPPPKSGVTDPLNLETLLSGTAAFFHAQCQRQNQELESIGSAPVKINVAEHGIPLRLGRHSGAECVTIEGYRDIRIKLGKGGSRQGIAATTLWLTSESGKPKFNEALKPFGWVGFRELSKEIWQKLDVLESAYQSGLAGKDTPIPSRDSKELAEEEATKKHPPRLPPAIVKEPTASATKQPINRQSGSKDLLSLASSLRPNDKIALERLMKALDAQKDRALTRKVAEMIKSKLVQAGTWKKHPLKTEIEFYMKE
ncbi:MAG: type III-A CRISPR-associated RAMP protein Csm5 [Desulforhabdus sp.]|nr:type III-A CRISPR-associated RAMP protein Csm5 [Desulforhabdus sp.]